MIISNILVDPIIFLVPDRDANKQEVSDWIERLKNWLQEVSNSPYQWYHCATIVLKHMGYNHFPTMQTLRAWQRKYQMDIDIHEIINAFTSFFLHESYSVQRTLEAELLARDYVAEATAIILSPQQYIERWPAPIRDEMSFVLALAGASKSKQIPFACALSIATLALSMTERELVVEGIASFLSNDEVQQPQHFSENFSLLYSPEDMEFFNNVVELWKQGEKGVQKAIERQFMKYWSHKAPLPFSFGPQFFLSIRQHNLETNKIVLTKIVHFAAAIVANTIQDLKCNLHPLHEDDPPSPQRTRLGDGAKAWRLELVPRGVGWRMHYWHIPSPQGGRIEFAKILRKHDPEDIG